MFTILDECGLRRCEELSRVPLNEQLSSIRKGNKLGLSFDVGDRINSIGGTGEGYDWVNRGGVIAYEGRFYGVSLPKLIGGAAIALLRPQGERFYNDKFILPEYTAATRYAREAAALELLASEGIAVLKPNLALMQQLKEECNVDALVREQVQGLTPLADIYGRSKAHHHLFIQRSGTLLKRIHKYMVHGDFWPGDILSAESGRLYLDHISFKVNPEMSRDVARAKDLKHAYFTALFRVPLDEHEVAETLLDAYAPRVAVREALHEDAEKHRLFAEMGFVSPLERLFTGTVWGIKNIPALVQAYQALEDATK